LLAWRPDIQIADIRGNVDSRLRKLEEAQYDAILLAAAGLTRLQLMDRVTQILPTDRILPAIGQGALGLECREDDAMTLEAILPVNHSATSSSVTAERSLLASLLAGCLAPVAALGIALPDQRLSLTARVSSLDGSHCIEGSLVGSIDQPIELGSQLAAQLKEQGALSLIDAARSTSRE
jgi:hydroxymethylbilane synthase